MLPKGVGVKSPTVAAPELMQSKSKTVQPQRASKKSSGPVKSSKAATTRNKESKQFTRNSSFEKRHVNLKEWSTTMFKAERAYQTAQCEQMMLFFTQ